MERDTILSNIGKAFIYSPNSQRWSYFILLHCSTKIK
jgi:hypothetical protein